MKLSLHALKMVPKAIIRGAQAKSPEILAGLAIAGVVLVVVESIKAGPEVKEAVEEAEEDLKDLEEHDELTKEAKRKVLLVAAKRIGIAVVPAFVAAFLTIGCIVGSLYFNNKQKAMLVAAATVSENQLQEYKDKVKELFGERKASQVDSDITSDKLRQLPKNADERFIIETGRGSDVIWDAEIGSLVRSSLEEYRRAALDMSDMMVHAKGDMEDPYWPTKADFLDRLGIRTDLRPSGCEMQLLSPDKGTTKSFSVTPEPHIDPYNPDNYITGIRYNTEMTKYYRYHSDR